LANPALAFDDEFGDHSPMSEFLELAQRGRTQWWRYPLAIVLAVVLWLIACTAAIVALGLAHVMPADISAELTQPTHIAVFFGATGAMFGALLASFAIAIAVVHGKRFASIVGVWRWRRLAIGAAVWVVVCILGGAVDFGLQPGGFHASASAATWRLALWAIPSLTIQTFTEEFIFRGYVTQALLLATRRPLATAVLSGLCFALLHIPNGWPQAASALAFGVITALIAIRTAGIAFTFGLHLANNLFGALIVVSANDVFRGSPALITQATPRLMWFDAALPFIALLALLWLVAKPAGRLSPRRSPIPPSWRKPGPRVF
jgi:hypothetical protein